MTKRRRSTKRYAYIPDVQITPDTDVTHIEACGRYLREMKPDRIILAGDWWDMHSLETFSKEGSKDWESKNIKADYECGNEALAMFTRLVRTRAYNPVIEMTLGNHEYRIIRAAESPFGQKFKEFLNYDHLATKKCKVHAHPFLEIIVRDGVMFSHYFNNPDSKMTNPIGGSIQNRLWKLGDSFCAGHEQVAIHGQVYTATGQRRCGIVAGRFYQEDLDYLGPQKSKQSWSGIYILNEVNNGSFDAMPVSMEYLLDEK